MKAIRFLFISIIIGFPIAAIGKVSKEIRKIILEGKKEDKDGEKLAALIEKAKKDEKFSLAETFKGEWRNPPRWTKLSSVHIVRDGGYRDAVATRSKWDLLTFAIAHGSEAQIKVLVENGAPLNNIIEQDLSFLGVHQKVVKYPLKLMLDMNLTLELWTLLLEKGALFQDKHVSVTPLFWELANLVKKKHVLAGWKEEEIQKCIKTTSLKIGIPEDYIHNLEYSSALWQNYSYAHEVIFDKILPSHLEKIYKIVQGNWGPFFEKFARFCVKKERWDEVFYLYKLYPKDFSWISKELLTTPKDRFSVRKQIDVLQQLFEINAPTIPLDNLGNNIIHFAVLKRCSKDLIDLLAQVYPEAMSEVNLFGQTPAEMMAAIKSKCSGCAHCFEG